MLHIDVFSLLVGLDHHGREHRRTAVRATVNIARKPPENIPEVSPETQNALD